MGIHDPMFWIFDKDAWSVFSSTVDMYRIFSRHSPAPFIHEFVYMSAITFVVMFTIFFLLHALFLTKIIVRFTWSDIDKCYLL